MKKLRYLITQICASGVDKAKSRKTTICLSASKYILENKDEFEIEDLDWYKVSLNKMYLKESMESLYENTHLEIFKNEDIKNIIENISDETFEKIITGLNEMQANATLFEVIEEYRETASIEAALEQNITANSILEVLIRMLDIKENSNVIDLFNGESGVAVIIHNMFKELNKDISSIKYYGQELAKDCFDIGQLIAYLVFKQNMKIVNADSFTNPAFIEDNKFKTYDYAISNPAYIGRGNCESSYLNNSLPGLEVEQKICNSHWLPALSILASLNDNGTGAVLMNKSPLFSSASIDIKIRKYLLSEDVIEAIVKIPTRILSTANIEAYWIIFNKHKPSDKKNKIKFIDISEEVEEIDRRHRAITKKGIEFAVNAYQDTVNNELLGDKQFENGNCNLLNKNLDIKEICENNYNLDGFEYFKQQNIYSNMGVMDMFSLQSIATIRRGIQLNKNRLDVLNKAENKTHYVIGSGNLENEKIILDEKSKIPVENRWRDLYELREGDIVITTKGSLFKMAIVDSNIKNAIISANLSFIRVDKNKYKPEVLKYYFDSDEGREFIEFFMRGTTTIKSLSIKDLEGLLIPDIDLKQQERISEAIIKSKKDYKEAIEKAEEKYKLDKKHIDQMIGL